MTSRPRFPLGVGIAGGALLALVLERRRGRRRAWVLLASAAVVALVIGLRLATTPPTHPPVVGATVRQLARAPAVYEGEHVATEGDARVFAAGRADEYFVLEQAGQDRVGLRGVPAATLTPWVGSAVAVDGVFRFEEGFGIAIRVEEIAPVGTIPAAATE
ncbi:MAG TPA: hypothetical protein VH482_09085 [Thermomicrobiales bacterium]|jgi:hypothetical protein